ncbi:MAG: NAD-dependent epimerase/dehydratase family protein [Gemmatimonadetes bacterium]|nr:NAD-dependent epimerase/dehydratase family protein [Gemmatimonadota bacterium]
MSPTRRDFIRTTGVVGAGLALGANAACSGGEDGGAEAQAEGGSASASVEPKRLLILGGTGFIGPHMVEYALSRGHEVTTFTRGRSQTQLPAGVEQLVGDRNDDHTALEGRTWDVVLDNNTQDYRWVQTSTSLLADAAEHYIFVSSISAYDLSGAGGSPDQVVLEPIVDEDYALITPPEGWTDGDDAPYGLMKALAEGIVHGAFPGRATVVRPGLIVGPGDPTDRFTYWPVRLDEGGEVLAPGNPEHANQVIDQRDLTEWIVRLAESGTAGDFNATGPAERMSMAQMLDRVGAAASNPYELTWVTEAFLQEQGVAPWSDLPAWIPGDPLMFVDVRSAVAAGLTFRDLTETSRDTLVWDRARPAEARANRQFGMSRERERAALDAWAAR